MSEIFYQETKDIPNPLKYLGVSKIIAGVIVLIISLLAYSDLKDAIQFILQQNNFANSGIYAAGVIIESILFVSWVIWALKSIIIGIKEQGKIIFSPEMPPSFSNYESVYTSLVKRSLPVYNMPSSGPLYTARRFFSEKIPFMTTRVRQIVSENISYLKSVIFLLVLLIIVQVFRDNLVGLLANDKVSSENLFSFPIIFVIILLAISAGKIYSIMKLIPNSKPKTEVDETIKIIKGGGDPSLFPLELEKSLIEIKVNNIPNRIFKSGFNEVKSEITEAGRIDGKIFVENQPQYISGEIDSIVYFFLTAGVILLVWGVYNVLFFPSISRSNIIDVNGAFTLADYVWSIFKGLVIAYTGSGFFRQAEYLLASFRYKSIFTVIDINGTLGKSEIKVGKAIHDSFESSNTIIRSDLQVKAYCAKLLTENFHLDGKRDIIGMIVDEEAKSASDIIGQTVEDFQKKGASIRKLDIESEGLADMAKANIIYQQKARQEFKDKESLDQITDSVKKNELLANNSNQTMENNSIENNSQIKICPDCAEEVKAKARKCRFCGYIFEE
ncbi:MAG: zinc ribbon domain-containing protein [Ignavibacteriaceae bacterium]